MCKTPKPKPIQIPPTEILHNPFADARRGAAGIYFANRLGRSSLRIRRPGESRAPARVALPAPVPPQLTREQQIQDFAANNPGRFYVPLR